MLPRRLRPPQAGTANVTGTLTGEDQERWLADGLHHSPARWNVIAQQVMMSRIKFPNPTGGVPAIIANLDQWDGYAPQRPRAAARGCRSGDRLVTLCGGRADIRGPVTEPHTSVRTSLVRADSDGGGVARCGCGAGRGG